MYRLGFGVDGLGLEGRSLKSESSNPLVAEGFWVCRRYIQVTARRNPNVLIPKPQTLNPNFKALKAELLEGLKTPKTEKFPRFFQPKP